MANEAEIINNPDSTPGAVSTGYQAQNTNLVAQRTGLDLSYVSGGAGTATVEISGPVDVNGVLYNIKSQTVLTPPSAGRYYITLQGAGPQYLTPTLGTSAGTYDALKNARYDTSGYRVLNWIIYFDGTTAYVTRLLTPEQNVNGIAFGDGPLRPIGEPDETYIITSATAWTATRSGYYKIYASNAAATKIAVKRIWINLGDTWTTTISTVTGPPVIYTSSITDGVTTISIIFNSSIGWAISGNDYAFNYGFSNSSGTAIAGFLIVG